MSIFRIIALASSAGIVSVASSQLAHANCRFIEETLYCDGLEVDEGNSEELIFDYWRSEAAKPDQSDASGGFRGPASVAPPVAPPGDPASVAPPGGTGMGSVHYGGVDVAYVSPDGLSILATRAFVGPQEYPPQEFAAYGIVAFSSGETPNTRQRHLSICHAYWAVFEEASNVSTPLEKQMVTVWPVDTAEIAARIKSEDNMYSGCEDAVAKYHLGTGQTAISHARRSVDDYLSGRGPFLLAWSPASAKGEDDAPVLIFNLSGASTEAHYLDYFSTWKEKIQDNPDLWDSEGGWISNIKQKIKEIADSQGNEIVMFIWKGGQ